MRIIYVFKKKKITRTVMGFNLKGLKFSGMLCAQWAPITQMPVIWVPSRKVRILYVFQTIFNFSNPLTWDVFSHWKGFNDGIFEGWGNRTGCCFCVSPW